MHDPELPASVLQTIEQRVKRRIRRQLTMGVLTLSLAFTLFMASATAWYPDQRLWGMASGVLLLVWIPYTLWFVYRALVERGIRREVEREHQRQLQLAREGGRVKREDRYAQRMDAHESLLDDDGELWIEDEPRLEAKPKRRLER